MKKYLFLLFFSTVVWCPYAQNPQKVLHSLQKAGKNRGELERVIRHYQQDNISKSDTSYANDECVDADGCACEDLPIE